MYVQTNHLTKKKKNKKNNKFQRQNNELKPRTNVMQETHNFNMPIERLTDRKTDRKETFQSTIIY
jgi:hypothetical protein